MNAIAAMSVCDWEGNPAHRPLTGVGRGHISGKGFAPRERHETADETFATAQAIWNHAQKTSARGVVVQAFWTDCCDHRHLLFHNGRDCRLLTRAAVTAKGYDDAVRASRRRVMQIAASQEQSVEAVRLGRDVQEAEWRDPADNNPNARKPKTVRGHRRYDVLRGLKDGGDLVTIQHVATADRYRLDYEVGHEGANPGGEGGLVRVDQAYQEDGPTHRRLAAMARYREATVAVGQTLNVILVHVVLLNRDVTSYAVPRNIRREIAMGYLVAALDRLLEHYGEPSLDDLRRAEDG